MKKLNLPKKSKKDVAHSLIKGVLSSIPVVGGIASETFGLILSEPISKRREDWMIAVVEELVELEKTLSGFKINQLKNDEEFVTFLLQASQIAFKTHEQKKLECLKNAIGNYYQYNIEFDQKYSFLKIIDELTPIHINILSFVSIHEDYIIESIKGYSDLLGFYLQGNNIDIDKYYFRKCVRDLENASLIRISGDFHDYIGGGGFASDESAPSIKLLNYGKDFLSFLISKNLH